MNLLEGNLGIPRFKMPQLAGFPAKGSKAETLPRDPAFGGVDLGPQFWASLEEKGAKLEHYREEPAKLKATQNELNMEKVEKLAQAIRKGELVEQCLFISADLHVIDGHHRWAAYVLAGYHYVPVSRVDMETPEVLEEALSFQAEWGPLE